MGDKATAGFQIWHVWCDQDGISHQTKRWIDSFTQTIFLDGLPSIWRYQPAATPHTVLMLTLIPGQDYEWHENPCPQWIVPLQGRWYVETMDGVRVEMGPGEISFGADQNCRPVDGRRGHRSGAVGSEPAVIMLIQVDTDPFSEIVLT